MNNWIMAGEFDDYGNPVISNFIDGEHYPELSNYNDTWWIDQTTHYCSDIHSPYQVFLKNRERTFSLSTNLLKGDTYEKY